ncbi:MULTISPECIES: LamG-like jellyroll fold domain-containing protein [unclassified Streptomyces]|uniref:CBM96 family carbohydrate-binding protein n=1 Tax=unclassified Streptomyces TaxID=2593676 RepID=UPI000DC75B5F|nr:MULTISPECIES: LamG-like jellyroll fold domain-containing protein [unclassified Streptomyces]AWZ06191.1 LamG domain-containing protein [Streptomyces sp. ICC4]AWZ13813.1 LamG domain-containing protein [Streptomyces sp. ICC1]
MRRSRGLTAALVLSLAGAGTGLGLVLIPEASAITQPVAFTADNLPTWQPNGIVWAMDQAGGTVFAGGTFSAVRPPDGAAGAEQEAVNFVALDAATGAPSSCKLSFTVGDGSATVRALTVSKDKKTLYAGGYFGAVNGTPVSSVAAIDIETCTPKASFHPNFPATVRALAVTDDTLYAAGDFSNVEGQTRERFAAVDAASGALKPFVANVDEPGRAVQVSNDGKNVLLGGDFFTVNGSNSHALAVVNATTGAVTKTYSNIPANSVVKHIAADSTGYYTGNEGSGGGVFDGRIGLATNFSEKWRDRCLGATQYVLPYDGVLYSSSHAHDCSLEGQFPDGKRHFLLAQLTDHEGAAPAPADGFVRSPRKLGWHPNANDGLGEGIGPRVMTIAEKSSTKYMWVGGEFTLINGKAQQALTRFASTGDVAAPTTPVSSVSSVKPGEVQVRWRASYDQDDSKLTYRVYRNGSATPVATLTAESLEWQRQQASWTDATVKAGLSYSYRVTATDAAGNTSALSASTSVTVPSSVLAYPNQVRADGANLYWRYDDTVSPYVADSSDGGNTSGIQLNAPALRQTPGAVTGASTAMGFNGTSQKVYSDHRQTVGSSYSIETWFKTNSTRGGKLIGFGTNTDRNSGLYDKHVYMTNNGRIVFGTNPGSVKTISTGLLDTFNDNKWHHVVATQGPAGMALYVDGQSKGTLNVTGSQQFEGFWHVGGDNLSGWPTKPSSNFFAGQIDETAVYPKVLTQAQVKNHFDLAKAATDTVSKVTTTEDTYINQGAPSTAYGTVSSLAVRGTSAYETYLRFDIPAAPAGQVLKSASLQIKTSTAAGAGTTDTVSVVPVTGTWSGAGTTFKTKPTLGTTPLGSLAGAPDGSAIQNVQLDTAALSSVLGTSYSLGLTSTGTDPLWIWSSEATAADAAPQLVLTFGAK